MVSRTQITLESHTHRRARQRASELGVSLAEYMRRLVARDLAGPQARGDVTFDLGKSGGSDIGKDKDSRITNVFELTRKQSHAIRSSRDAGIVSRFGSFGRS